jgi:hypothetical protein
MTLEGFAKKTGWPIDELMGLTFDEFEEILSLMGMTLKFKKLKKPKKTYECPYCGPIEKKEIDLHGDCKAQWLTYNGKLE